MAKIENNLRKYLTLLSCALIVLSGCKNNPVSSVSGLGKVSGTIMMYDSATGKSWPLPGIKVYIVNTNFKPDTVNYANNQAAFVDSAVTDSSGKYIISNIKTGNYAVAPMPVPGNYHFSLATGSDPDSITISSRRPAYSVNFTTPYPGTVGTVSGEFNIVFMNKNVPKVAPGWQLEIYPFRTYYLVFIPESSPERIAQSFFPADSLTPKTFNYAYGWTTLLITESNQFNIKFTQVTINDADQEVFNDIWYAYYDFTLSNCPASSVFEIDWTAHILKRIQ